MKKIVIVVASLVLPNIIWGACAPDKMLRVVFRDATPGLDANSFAAKPKTLYRLGNRLGRVEEAPDPDHGIHGLIVVSEPDSWIVNLATKTGQHVVDSGAPYEFHAPILGGSRASDFLKSFEFGCEIAFMKDRAITPTPVQVETRKLASYRVSEGNQTIFLAVDVTLQKPVVAALYENGKVVTYLKYLSYDSDLAPDPSLFKPPSGVTLSEAK